jgi:hypothetical protein
VKRAALSRPLARRLICGDHESVMKKEAPMIGESDPSEHHGGVPHGLSPLAPAARAWIGFAEIHTAPPYVISVTGAS